MSVRAGVVVAPLLALMGACASFGSQPSGGSGGGVESRDGAIVLSGVALEDGRGTVLAAIRGKVPGMRIQRHPDACPEVNLRRSVSYIEIPNPHVYVDGIRATDTCVLEQLRAGDVEFLEVYPSGVTRRPGYGSHTYGLILIFMRSL